VTRRSKQKAKYSWLSVIEILAVHEKLLALFGGATGFRGLGLLESAISRAQNFYLHEKPNIFDLAAIYADGIVNNHPFVDGNKRTGFVAAILFLESNGLEFFGAETEAVIMTVGLADKSISRDQYAEWLKQNSK
jgi:death-on-curing protein